MDDELWTHFGPLWSTFTSVGEEILVAGGYGLFLKQQWLRSEGDSEIIVPLERWTDATPRVTKDLDFVIGLDLIADESLNGRLRKALEEQGFNVSKRPQGKQWQFVKEISEDRVVLAELHAQTPPKNAGNLKTGRIRVKHKPSLGKLGVHGRHNPEAVGSELHPCAFSINDVTVAVPNAMTWSIMKLTAMHDQWSRAQDVEKDANDRAFFRAQAIKHGQDVCRAVAMMSIDERDSAGEVVEAVRETPQFEGAGSIYNDFFAGAEGWANGVLSNYWLPQDLETILGVLGSWFAREEGQS